VVCIPVGAGLFSRSSRWSGTELVLTNGGRLVARPATRVSGIGVSSKRGMLGDDGTDSLSTD
jgi:hypothetical protein